MFVFYQKIEKYILNQTGNKKWGLWCKTISDWMMESRTQIASWETEKEAESFRKNHTVHKEMYEVKKISND